MECLCSGTCPVGAELNKFFLVLYKVEVKSGVKCTFKSGCTFYLFFGMLWVEAKVLKERIWMATCGCRRVANKFIMRNSTLQNATQISYYRDS
jgi:hypothetical protein